MSRHDGQGHETKRLLNDLKGNSASKKRKEAAGEGAHMGRRPEVERIDGWPVLVVGPAACRRYNLYPER